MDLQSQHIAVLHAYAIKEKCGEEDFVQYISCFDTSLAALKKESDLLHKYGFLKIYNMEIFLTESGHHVRRARIKELRDKYDNYSEKLRHYLNLDL